MTSNEQSAHTRYCCHRYLTSKIKKLTGRIIKHGDILVAQPFVEPTNDKAWPKVVWRLRVGAFLTAGDHFLTQLAQTEDALFGHSQTTATAADILRDINGALV